MPGPRQGIAPTETYVPPFSDEAIALYEAQGWRFIDDQRMLVRIHGDRGVTEQIGFATLVPLYRIYPVGSSGTDDSEFASITWSRFFTSGRFFQPQTQANEPFHIENRPDEAVYVITQRDTDLQLVLPTVFDLEMVHTMMLEPGMLFSQDNMYPPLEGGSPLDPN